MIWHFCAFHDTHKKPLIVFFCFCVLCNVFLTFTWPRTKRKFCTMNFCSIGFYQFLKVVTPVHRHCSVNVPQLTFAIKKKYSPMWWNEMTLKSKRVIFTQISNSFLWKFLVVLYFYVFSVANRQQNRITQQIHVYWSTQQIHIISWRVQNDPVWQFAWSGVQVQIET